MEEQIKTDKNSVQGISRTLFCLGSIKKAVLDGLLPPGRARGVPDLESFALHIQIGFAAPVVVGKYF